MKIIFASIFLLTMMHSFIGAQETIELFPEGIPNSKIPDDQKVEDSLVAGVYYRVIHPALEIYLPEKEKATGTGVIICPGGGYSVVVYEGEGVQTAKKFAAQGVAAFVLRYRLPNDLYMEDKTTGPLQDVQQAFKLVRENAEHWGVDTNRLGLMGFSAGGHLASTGATHFDQVVISNPENTNLRPDFQILVYPVISMADSLTHMGSRVNLLGHNPSTDIIKRYSNELQVTKNTPPAYLTHTSDDKLVDVDNSILYFEALRRQGVPVEMHIFQEGDHGFIFRYQGWMDPLFKWLTNNGWLPQ